MAARDIWVFQENASGLYERVLLQQSPSGKHSIVTNSTGVVVIVPAVAHIPDSAAAQSAALATSNLDDGSGNNTLIGMSGTYNASEASSIEQNFDKVADELETLRLLTNELQSKLNLALAALRTHNLLLTE